MRLLILIATELILLIASVLIFRSLWALLDQYLGQAHLWLMLIIGLILTVIALIIVNYELKYELRHKNHFETQKHKEATPETQVAKLRLTSAILNSNHL